MKLLILTQKVDKNDPVLGFFHRWLEEFAKHFERVTVICLEEGPHSLPGNVKILSLGKESGASKVKYLSKFYRYIWKERNNYDSIFVHMNPEYVVLGGLFWRMWHKKVSLWYVHRQTNTKLWFAEKLSHNIFTSSPESFKLKSSKVNYVGHGISIGPLCVVHERRAGELRLLHVGRITPIKRCEILLEAAVVLKKNFENLKVVFAGDATVDTDKAYIQNLKQFIMEKGLEQNAEFLGNIAFPRVREEMCKADATINLAPTGGMDKVVLESLATGVPAFFANEAFLEVVKERSGDFHINPASAEVVASKISSYFSRGGGNDISELTLSVRDYFSIPSLISRIAPSL